MRRVLTMSAMTLVEPPSARELTHPIYQQDPLVYRVSGADWALFTLLLCMFYVLTPYDLISSVTGFGATGADSRTFQALDVIENGSFSRRFTVLSLGLLGAAVLIGNFQWARIRPVGWLISAYLLVAAASPSWADNPGFTARRVVVLATLCLAAFGFAMRWSRQTMLAFGFVACAFGLVLGFAAEVSLHTFRPGAVEYRFGGLMHPNNMATQCVILLLASLAYARSLVRWRVFFWMCAAISFAFLSLTKSRGALISVALAMAVCVPLATRRRTTLVLGLSALGIAAAWLVFGDIMTTVLNAVQMGRSDADLMTMTGRTDLWHQLMGFISQRPWLGYGYDGFWTPAHILEVAAVQGWVIGHSHSSYVDAIVSLGWVGFATFVGAMVSAMVVAWKSARFRGDPVRLFELAVLCWICTNSLVEVWLFETTIPCFVTMIILARIGFLPVELETSRDARLRIEVAHG